jgi:hypothetical protein
MSHICTWCDAVFETRFELEYHIESEHQLMRSSIRRML